MLIMAIADKLNMTIEYAYYANMDTLANLYVSNEFDMVGSGILNDLLLHNIDIAIGNIVISDKVHKTLAVSTPYTVVTEQNQFNTSLSLTLF